MSLLKNRSGQYLYFCLVGMNGSGAIIGASGLVSGRKSLDNLSGMIVLSGNIIELGGGSYRANLYDFDTNGNYAGYLFTSSGAAPVQYSLATVGGISGFLWIASGQSVLTYSGQLSGQPITLLSGLSYTASGINATVPPSSISGVVANSGLFVTATVGSGSLYLASGSIFPFTFSSGTIGTSGNLPTSWGNSGQVLAASGSTVVIPSTTLSGVFANVPIGSISGVIANSGLFTSVPIASISGVQIASGLSILIYSGQLSGQPFAPISGQTFLVSGQSINVNYWNGNPIVSGVSGVPTVNVGYSLGVPVTNSDFTIASGASTTITLPSTYTDGTTLPDDSRYEYSQLQVVGGTGEGQVVLITTAGANPRQYNVFSPTMPVQLTSGSQVVLGGTWRGFVNSGQLSGQLVNLLSGNQVQVWSGTQVNTFSGQTYIASGPFVVATASPPASGTTYLASGSFLFGSGQFFLGSGSITSGLIASGIVFPASGAFVTANAVVSSGALYLASGSIFPFTFSSGTIGSSGNLPSAWGSSGAVTVGQNLDKTGYTTLSGTTNLASGSITSGLIASGIVFPTSGAFVNATATVTSGQVYLASGSLVGLLSGQSVLVYSGQLSGQPVTPTSGQTYIASGPFVVATATIGSGTLYLASGSIFPFTFSSGTIGTSGNLPSAWGSSGAVTVGQNLDKTGYTVNSGTVFLGSGNTTIVGDFTNSAKTSIENTVWDALAASHINTQSMGQQMQAAGAWLGQFTVNDGSPTTTQFITTLTSLVDNFYNDLDVLFITGSLAGQARVITGYTGSTKTVQFDEALTSAPANGDKFLVLSPHDSSTKQTATAVWANAARTITSVTNLSGTFATASGTNYLASGSITSGMIASGIVFPTSGAFVNATATIASGTTYLASGSLVGLLSGQNVLLASGQLSGQQINLLSGNQVQVWSGTQVNVFSGTRTITAINLDKSGYILGATGVDLIQVESGSIGSGVNMRQAISAIGASAAGRLSGAGTVAVRMDGLSVSGTTRITAVVDASGNRTSVILNLP